MRLPDMPDQPQAILPPGGLGAEGRRRASPARLAAVAALVVLVAAVVRLSVAPLGLPLTGIVERAAAARGVDLTLERIALRLGAGRLFVTLEGVGVSTAKAAATVKRITLTQSLSGRAVTMKGADLKVDPSGEGGRVKVPEPGAAVALLGDVLHGLKSALSGAGLERVDLTDGRIDLVVPGRPINEARVFQDVEAHVEAADELGVRVAGIGAGGPFSLRLDYRDTATGRDLDIAVDGLVPRDLAPVKPVQDGFVLALNLSAALPAEGPAEARATIGISGGTVVMGDDPPREFGGGRIDLALTPDGRSITVLPSRFSAGLSTVTIAGDVTAGAGPDDPWTFDLSTPYTQLHSADIDKPPVELSSAKMHGEIDFARGMIRVDQFAGQAERGRADAVFTLDIHDGGPWLSLAAHIGPTSVDTLLGAWPVVAAYKPRKAIAEVVKGGTVRRGDVTLAFTPLEMDPDPTTHSDMPGTIGIDLEFVDVTFTAPGIPIAITRGHGALRMQDRILSVRLDGGVVDMGAAGLLRVSEGAFTIPDVSGQPAEASITATVQGPLSAIVAIATLMDLPQLKATPLEPDQVAGTFEAKIAMRTPLAPGTTMEERQWSIDAQLKGAGTSIPVSGQTFSDADVEVLLNSRRLAARGKATVDGIRIDVNYSEMFLGGKSGAARFVLTDRDRRERGFDTGTALTGPVVVTVEADPDDVRTFAVDLSQAAIDLPGLAKAKGVAMKATGQFSGAGANLSVDGLRVDGGGISATGNLALEGGALARANLHDVALSRGDSARVDVTRQGVGYQVDVEATTFDLRKLITSMMRGPAKPGDKAGEKKAGPPVAARAVAERLRLSDETYATDVSLEARHSGRALSRLSVSGRLDGVNAGSFAARLAPQESGGRTLHVDVTELGRVLAAFDVYKRMRGGRTRITAQIAPDGAMDGRMIVEDFALTDETTLEAIIERTRSNPRDRAGPRLARQIQTGTGLTFDTLVVDFDKRGDRIRIREAVLRGQVIGGTADGVIDLADKTMTLNGTFIPAYGVNNMFGRVPVLGQILGGGDDGGLIGVTFRLSGPLASPQFAMNPLSAVAPGIFRKIFEYR